MANGTISIGRASNGDLLVRISACRLRELAVSKPYERGFALGTILADISSAIGYSSPPVKPLRLIVDNTPEV